MESELEYIDHESIYDLRFNINFYGADFPIESLVRRLEENEIEIPEFQRQYVWKPEEASRFIESILLGLPVPNIFLAKDKFTYKFLIVDGLQRLETLYHFTRGHFPSGKRFALKGVDPHFNNLTYGSLPPEDRRNFDNYTIHATIISESDNSNRMFHLFERLNTSGTPLTSQEIRGCLYHGPFNLLLKELATHPLWLTLYGKGNTRMEGEELILRFFALHYELHQFRGNMKEFLNYFMSLNRTLESPDGNEMRDMFTNTLNYIIQSLGRDAFKLGRNFNSSVFDAVSYCGAFGSNRDISPNTFKAAFEAALADYEFIRLTRSSTTSRQNVLGRIEYLRRGMEQ